MTSVSSEIFPKTECPHPTTFNDENGMRICMECGLEIEVLDFVDEYRNYDISEVGVTGSMSRCHRVRQTKTLEKDFEGKNIPPAIAREAENYFFQITGEDTYRGLKRSAIIAACLMHAYADNGEPKTHEEIRKIFGLKKKKMTEGINEFGKVFREKTKRCIRPEDLIEHTFDLVGIPKKHIPQVLRISEYYRSASSSFVRANPQTAAAVYTYVFLLMNPEIRKKLGLTRASYSQLVKITGVSLTTLVAEAKIIGGIEEQD